MPTLTELQAKRSVGNSSETRVYHCQIVAADAPTYDPTPADARDYFNTQAPSVTGLVLTAVDVDEQYTIGNGSAVQTGHYIITATWGDVAPLTFTLNTVKTTSRTSLTTVKIRQSISTTQAKAASWWNSGTAEDYEGLINVDEKGKAQGVDIQVPTTVYTVTKRVLSSTINDTYEMAAHSIAGKTNSIVYRNRAVGTLLCSGVSISEATSAESEIAAEFLFATDESGITIGDISGINKPAWDYLWVKPAKRKVGERSIPGVAQANVEQVYSRSDFATALGF